MRLPLSKNDHINLRWLPRSDFFDVANEIAVPILLGEVSRAASSFPLAIAKHDQGYTLIGLLGLPGYKNFHINQGGLWTTSYVPASYRAFPFGLIENQHKEQILSVEQSHLTENQDGLNLFDREGNLAPEVAKTVNFLAQCERSKQETEYAIKLIVEIDILDRWEIPTIASGCWNVKDELAVIYKVNETKLRELSGDDLKSLVAFDALKIIYAQIISTDLINGYIDKCENYNRERLIADNTINIFEEQNGTLNLDFLG